MKSLQRFAAAASVLVLGALGAAGAAQARDVSWSVGLAGPGVSVGVGNAPAYPVYSAPVYSAPVYSAPVYQQPVYGAPVYAQPAPVYVAPTAYYPPTVVYRPAPVIYAPPGHWRGRHPVRWNPPPRGHQWR